LKTEEESWSGKGRCSALDLRAATQGFALVLPRMDLIFTEVSRLDSLECKLWVMDARLHSVRLNALIFSLLALQHRHHKETVMHRILVLWDRAIVVVRLGTMLISFPGSRQIRL
jgi:NAD-dependent oxidoreductase involved in siderophore biosynthesis